MDGGRRRLRDTAGSLFVRPTELVCGGGAPQATPSPCAAVVAGFRGTMKLIPGAVGDGMLAAGPVRLAIPEAGRPCTLAIRAEDLLPVSEGGFPGGCGG